MSACPDCCLKMFKCIRVHFHGKDDDAAGKKNGTIRGFGWGGWSQKKNKKEMEIIRSDEEGHFCGFIPALHC